MTSLLITVLKQANEKGKELTCSESLRALFIAQYERANDNNQWFISARDRSNSEGKSKWTLTMEDYAETEAIYWGCPKRKPGTYTKAYENFSYGMNTFGSSDFTPKRLDQTSSKKSWAAKNNYAIRTNSVSEVGDISDILWIADHQPIEEKRWDHAMLSVNYGWWGGWTENSWNKDVDARHFGIYKNVLFVDGHANLQGVADFTNGLVLRSE